ncbi:MAG: hypothetical protein AAGA60_10405 [Cyanobacteria bacterium P01_E01_bin.42]
MNSSSPSPEEPLVESLRPLSPSSFFNAIAFVPCLADLFVSRSQPLPVVLLPEKLSRL